MNTDNLKGKFNDIKGNVKNAWNKVTVDVKKKDFSDATQTAKEKLSELKTDTTNKKAP